MASPDPPQDAPKRAIAPPLPLEWTQQGQQGDTPKPVVVRFPWDVADVSIEDEEVMIVGTAGQKITKMGSDLYDRCNPKLKQLVLRSHLIKDMEGIAGFQELELLELYDNVVDKLQELNGGEGTYPGKSLRVLDMSYNVIRDMDPVSFCPNLRELCTFVLLHLRFKCIFFLCSACMHPFII